MRSRSCLAAISLLLAACQDNNVTLDDRWPGYLAESCPTYLADLKLNCPSVDLAPPAPKCAAAKGLTGDTLLCVDYSSLGNQLLTATPPPELPGWKFDATNCLEINGGKLQVKNFGSFVGTCSFSMPLTDLSSSANLKFQSVTLAVVQRVDVNPVSQKAQLMLGLDDPTTRLIDETRGTQPTQQRVYTVQKVALPNGGGAAYQPLFKLTSGALYAGSGWQIESIAVMGNP
ncbi:MAG TPA: hypothetical protein PLY80_05210 [Pseudomonadota bacterium]|nr:hypothetical protein [Pseudomonadota bacterium]